MRRILSLFAVVAFVAGVLPARADVNSFQTVRDFVAACQTPSEACNSEVSLVVAGDDWAGTICEPNLSDADYTAAIVGWLRNHSEENGQSVDDAIDDAALALWPCRGK